MVWIRCKYCNNIWFYRGSSLWATCPRCHGKNNVQQSQFTPWFYKLYEIVQQEFEKGCDLELWEAENSVKAKCNGVEITIEGEEAKAFAESIKQWALDEQAIIFPEDGDDFEVISADEQGTYFEDDAGDRYYAKLFEQKEEGDKIHIRIFARVVVKKGE